MKELLETNKAVKISLFLLTMLATAMVISDAILTPAISGTVKSSSVHYYRLPLS
jgi:K+ transporter